MTHPLTVHLIDDAACMWEQVIARWQADPDASLLVANDAAAERVIARLGGAARGDDRLLTMGRVIQAVRAQADLPEVGPEVQMLVAIADALADPANALELPESLRRHATSAATIEALADHIGELDQNAPADYVPDGEVEAGIWRLYEHLLATGAAAGTLRATQSRAAAGHDIGRRVIVPLTRLSRYHGMLLEGLSVHQPVDCFLLANPATADPAIAHIFDPQRIQVVEAYTGAHPAGALFGAGAVSGSCDLSMRAVDAEDEAAMALLATWIEEGVPPADLALVSGAPPERLERAAAAWGVPLRLWRNIGVHDTALGATIAQIARCDLMRPDARDSLRLRSPWPLTDEDLVRIQAARDQGAVAELAALVAWGDHQIDACDITRPMHARALQWLDALGRTHQLLEQHAVHLDRLDEVFARTVVPPRLWGAPDGVAVLGWGELGAGDFARVAYTGLSDYPPTARAQPFLTAATRRRWPVLADADRRPELVAALALAREEAVFLREATDDAGAERPAGLFWAEVERAAAGRDAPAGRDSRRRALRRFARLRQAADPEITRAAERAFAEGRPARLAAGAEAYSVTELELYLRCPYGWFVRHVLRPRGDVASPAARRGSVAHAALEQLVLHPGRDALDAVATLGADLTPLAQQTLAHQIERTLERYTGEAWPFDAHRTEVDLRSTELLPGRVVQGRADRIDDDGDALLVIDYKLRRRPIWLRPEARGGELQRYLYPLLAAEATGMTPLGALLVSLFHADHSGSLNAERDALIGPAVDLDFDEDAARAVDVAAVAIERIELGHWDEVGHACPEWCEHRLVSPIFPSVRGGA